MSKIDFTPFPTFQRKTDDTLAFLSKNIALEMGVKRGKSREQKRQKSKKRAKNETAKKRRSGNDSFPSHRMRRRSPKRIGKKNSKLYMGEDRQKRVRTAPPSKTRKTFDDRSRSNNFRTVSPIWSKFVTSFLSFARRTRIRFQNIFSSIR
jgi:hypothetical protein